MSAVVILDANVLIPNALCDLLLLLAEENLLRPRWTDQILDEVRRHVPVTSAAIDRRIRFMNEAFEDALVTAYRHLVDEMTNDPKDRHVLAAAVACDADRIITCNLRDFAPASCEPYGIEVEHPDDFSLRTLDREPRLVIRVVCEQAGDTGRHGPRLTRREVLDCLASAGAPRFAAAARPHLSKDEEPTTSR